MANLNPSPELSAAVETRDTNEFTRTQSPHFTVSHVVPGYVFGRNDLALGAGMMQSQNSSKNFLMVGLLGGELSFPIHGGFAHIEDVAEIHLRVALEEAYAGKDIGIATKVDYASIFDQIEDKYPEAVKARTLEKEDGSYATDGSRLECCGGLVG